MNVLDYYKNFDYSNYSIDPNKPYNLCLYSPSFNRILFVYDEYEVLKKIRLILSSKLRLEILNLSRCEDKDELNNSECISYEINFTKAFGLTCSTYQNSENDFMLRSSFNFDQNLIPIRDYVFFCFFIVKEFYFFITAFGMKNNFDELISVKSFYENVLPNSSAPRFFKERIIRLQQQQYFYNMLEKILFIEDSKQNSLLKIKKQIGEDFEYLVKNHHIELLVLDSFLRRNIKND